MKKNEVNCFVFSLYSTSFANAMLTLTHINFHRENPIGAITQHA